MTVPLGSIADYRPHDKKMGDAHFAALAQGLAEIGTPGLTSQYFKIFRLF
ncbi:MAG: hypothetical protein H7322_07060 [Ramlibacter sp.]|nr:hypothetical protein [Ramlibacter sp.]